MHGHGFPPGFIRALVLVQYLIFLSDPALAIRQQYLSGVLPVIDECYFLLILP